jgi:hypothetical protein
MKPHIRLDRMWHIWPMWRCAMGPEDIRAYIGKTPAEAYQGWANK